MLAKKKVLYFSAAISIAVSSIVSSSVLADDSGKNSLKITHGVSAGDVTNNSAIIWSRTNAESTMHVVVMGDRVKKHVVKKVTTNNDFAGKVKVEGLRANVEYEYKVWFTDAENKSKGSAGDVEKGKFRTAPNSNANQEIVFVWGGDLAGQNVCRDSKEGFPVFKAINEIKMDFFIGLGDMIYADGTCANIGRYGNSQIPGDFVKAADLKNYWAHWKYNKEDEGLKELLSSVAYYAVWDDHEVVNDFGPLHDTRSSEPYTVGEHLLPIGMHAMLNYNPIAEHAETPHRLYRNVRWGKQLEVFFLDNRQYRDANSSKDDTVISKTMLGREQLTWLKEKLSSSDATWKLIVSSVPISIPTGYPPSGGRDGWANFDAGTDYDNHLKGFESELMDIFKTLQKNKNNTVWITTDVHFAEVFRYTPFANDSSFHVYEFVTGPLNAGLFPNKNYDTTLGTESLFFYGPEGGDSGLSYQQAKEYMNYGVGSIDKFGNFTLQVRDVKGTVKFEQTLFPH